MQDTKGNTIATKGLSPQQITALEQLEKKFIENERQIQNKIFYEDGKGKIFDKLPESFDGFSGTFKPAKYHTTDLEQLKDTLENENDPAKKSAKLVHLERLAELRHKKEFLKYVRENYDDVMDVIDPDKNVDSKTRAENKELFQDVQNHYDGWISQYKKNVFDPKDFNSMKERDEFFERETGNIHGDERQEIFSSFVNDPKNKRDFASPDYEGTEKLFEEREEINVNDLQQPQKKVAPPKTYTFCSMTDIVKEVSSIGKQFLQWLKIMPPPMTDIEKVNKLTEIQTPFKEAVENEKKSSDYNFNLSKEIFIANNENKNTTVLTGEQLTNETKRINSAFMVIERPNSRNGIMGMYMLHKGMSLDDIVSTNPKLDEQKKLYMGELHQIMFKATVAIENAQNAARETEGAKFEKTKEKFIEDAIEEREKKRAKEFAAKNPPLNEQEARKALPPLTAKELEIRDKDIADDFRIEKGKVCIEAAKIAKENTMKTSEDVIAFKNVYLDMGVALSNQEFPAKPISDLHASAKNIEKVGLLKSMSLNYTDMLGKFGSDHGLDAEKTEKTKNAASVIDRSTFAALSCINFAAGDDFTNAANPNPGTMLHVRTSQEMFKELDAVTKGKEKFSDVEPGTGKKLMDKTFQLETGMEKKLFKPNSFDLKDPSGELSKNIEVFSPPKESVKVKENSASNVRK